MNIDIRQIIPHIIRLGILTGFFLAIRGTAKAFKNFIFELIDHIKSNNTKPPWEQ